MKMEKKHERLTVIMKKRLEELERYKNIEHGKEFFFSAKMLSSGWLRHEIFAERGRIICDGIEVEGELIQKDGGVLVRLYNDEFVSNPLLSGVWTTSGLVFRVIRRGRSYQTSKDTLIFHNGNLGVSLRSFILNEALKDFACRKAMTTDLYYLARKYPIDKRVFVEVTFEKGLDGKDIREVMAISEISNGKYYPDGMSYYYDALDVVELKNPPEWSEFWALAQ